MQILGKKYSTVLCNSVCTRYNVPFACLFVYSIKHEYSAWDDKNPTVQTCNANNKITPGSHTPQDVVPEAYVVFSYDVTFEVELPSEDSFDELLVPLELIYLN